MDENIKKILEIKEDFDYKRLSIEDIMLLQYYIFKLNKKLTALSKSLNKKHNLLIQIKEVINQPLNNYSSCIKAFDEIELLLDKE